MWSRQLGLGNIRSSFEWMVRSSNRSCMGMVRKHMNILQLMAHRSRVGRLILRSRRSIELEMVHKRSMKRLMILGSNIQLLGMALILHSRCLWIHRTSRGGRMAIRSKWSRFKRLAHMYSTLG
jgi:hypothetical protein